MRAAVPAGPRSGTEESAELPLWERFGNGAPLKDEGAIALIYLMRDCQPEP